MIPGYYPTLAWTDK